MTEPAAHSQVWQCVSLATNPVTGGVITVPRSYTELATGLNYVDQSGQLQPTREEFALKAPGAVAECGPHNVRLAANIHTVGAVDVVGPDGVRFQNHPLAIAYYDAQSGQRVIVAEVQDCVGELVAPNEVRYEGAFRGLNASLRYTYLKAGLACDAILHEAPPPPSAYGLSDKYTRLEMLTELLLGDYKPSEDAHVIAGEPDPAVRQSMVEPDFADVTLGFGEMSLGPGRAFSVGAGDAPPGIVRVPVAKRLAVMDGTTILIEAVQYSAVQPMLDQLGMSSASVRQQLPGGATGARAAAIAPPKHGTASASLPKVSAGPARAKTERMSVAMRPASLKGLVLDWEYLNTANSVTLKSGTTYYVTGIVNLSGTTTIEGGSVVKYAPSTATPRININGTLQCLATPYQPAVFTARDDNSVGEILPDSIGNPLPPAGYQYGNPALYFGYYAVGPMRNVRISYAVTGFEMYSTASGGQSFDIWHSQFVHCTNGVLGGYRSINLRNVLLADVSYTFAGYGDVVRGQNLTLHSVGVVADAETTAVFTNCVFSYVSSFGSAVSGGYNGFAPAEYPRFGNPRTNESSGLAGFQVLGGASHYLRSGSPFRDFGTKQIDPDLLLDLKRMTTWAPTEFTTMPTNAACLPQKVQRDYDLLDLGYHYDAIDWVVCGLAVSQPLTLKPGVVVATRGQIGINLQPGGSLFSVGSPVNLNRVVHYNCVQEQFTDDWASPLWSWTVTHGSNQTPGTPATYARCTDFAALGGTTLHFTVSLGSYHFTDCQFRAGVLYFCVPVEGSDGISLCLTNNLFERVATGLVGWYNPMTVSSRNNLFMGGSLSTVSYAGFNFYDNLFDRTTISQTGPITNDYNAYRLNFNRLSPNGQHDVIFSLLSYAIGPLGRYYVNSSTPTLVNAGSRLASAANLSHYTTKTSQVQEGSTIVDIGLHYAPVMGVSEIPKSSMTLTSDPSAFQWALSLVIDDVLNHEVPWFEPLVRGTTNLPDCVDIPTGWLRMDLGASQPVAMFGYRSNPETGDATDFAMRDYELYVTDNTNNWGTPVASGSWSWCTNRPAEQAAENKVVRFQPATGRYVILKCVRGPDEPSDQEAISRMSAHEIWLYKSNSVAKTFLPVDANANGTDDYLEDWGQPPDLSGALGLRVRVENDIICDPANGNTNRQIVRASVVCPPGHPGVTYAYSVNLVALVEMQEYCYDYVSLKVDDNMLEPGEASDRPFEDRFVVCHGDECFLGCGQFATKNQTKVIRLLGGSDRILEYDTVDYKFHVGAYAEIPSNSQVLYQSASQPPALP